MDMDVATPVTENRAWVAFVYCPMGCGQTLMVGPVTRELFCFAVDCPRPTAAAQILADPETDHIATVTADEFTLRHPLRERLDDALLHCDVHRWLSRGAPNEPGRWRIRTDPRLPRLREGDNGVCTWEPMQEEGQP